MSTPAGETLQSNMEKLHGFMLLMRRGIVGIAKELNVPRDSENFLPELERVLAHFSGITVAVEWLPVMMVTMAEAYLLDVLVYAATQDPTFMGDANPSISYSELASASSLDEVLAELRYRWAKNFLDKGGPQSWMDRLTKMGARGYPPETGPALETLWGIRHLIVHTAGVVTADFTRRYPHLGMKVGEKVPAGFLWAARWMKPIQDFANVTEAFVLQRCQQGSQ